MKITKREREREKLDKGSKRRERENCIYWIREKTKKGDMEGTELCKENERVRESEQIN